MDLDVLARAVDLWNGREPFALATVVWRRAPSSGHLGSKAVIRSDGTIEGWLGGACAQPTVVREALAAMGDGKARLVLLGQPDELHERPDDGIVKVPMACESDGAMEIYLEPVFPRPQVVVIGRSPAVFSLARLATDLDWDVTVVDQGGHPDDHPRPELVRTALELSDLGIGPGSAVVVATQGTYDDAALEAALSSDAGYIGLVASEKRTSATFERLRERGVTEEQLARVTAPAGLDLGPIDNSSIAVAVLAELVAWQVGGNRNAVVPPPTRHEVLDPVCGMVVVIEGANHHTTHDGVDYWFCSAGCLAAFEKDPAAFIGT
jgi:xanthine dehydrogenase accessory factor